MRMIASIRVEVESQYLILIWRTPKLSVKLIRMF